MTFMVNNGSWRLQVRRDGQHNIGFVALPQRVAVNSDAFRFEQVYDSVATHVHQQVGLYGQENQAEPYRFEATFSWLDQNDTDLVYLIDADASPYMITLFRKAYHNRDSANTFASDYKLIQRYGMMHRS